MNIKNPPMSYILVLARGAIVGLVFGLVLNFFGFVFIAPLSLQDAFIKSLTAGLLYGTAIGVITVYKRNFWKTMTLYKQLSLTFLLLTSITAAHALITRYQNHRHSCCDYSGVTKYDRPNVD